MFDAPFFRYFPETRRDRDRGIHLASIGYRPKNVPAATTNWQESVHPEPYWFDKQHRRTLSCYQFVYITAGQGYFESGLSTRETFSGGTVLCLVPGIWHDYAVTRGTGWEAYSVGLGGERAESFCPPGLVRPKQPVLRLGLVPDLVAAYRSLLTLVAGDSPGSDELRVVEAWRVTALIAQVLQAGKASGESAKPQLEQISRARRIIESGVEDLVSMQDVAARVSMGYTSFRSWFRRATGLSPRAYLLALRLERARNLLTGTDLSVKSIAARLRFNTPFYFMRFFKQRTGMTPTAWRLYSRGEAETG